MKPKLLEHIVRAGLALSLNVLIGCQVLDNNVKSSDYDSSTPQEITQKLDEQLKILARQYQTKVLYGGEYRLIKNPLVTERQKEILAEMPQQIQGNYKPKYHTSAHLILEMEQEFGATADDYQILESILDTIIPKISAKGEYSRKDAFSILRTIASSLKGLQKKETTSFHYALENRVFDCDNFAAVYSAVGEILNLPIKMVSVMDHVFIRWDLGREHLNWDNMWMDRDYNACMDITYKNKYGKNALFVEMGRKEILASCYTSRGLDFIKKGMPNEAINLFNIALELFPNDMLTIYNTGVALSQLRDYNNALAALNQVIRYNENHASGFFERGRVLDYMGLYNEAIADFTRVLEINPKSDAAYEKRGNVWKKLDNIEKANLDFQEMDRIRFPNGRADSIMWVEESLE